MPTPSPIIVAIVVEICEMSKKLVRTVTAERPTARPTRAVPIGTPMATTDPNAISSTMADRTGVDPETDLRPRLIAGAVVVAMRVAVEQWGEGGGHGDLRDMVERALDLLDGGLDHSI